MEQSPGISQTPNPQRRRAVITGIGPITACGIGRDAFWSAIRSGQGGIGPVTSFDASMFQARQAGEVKGWDPAAFFPSHRLKRLDRFAQFAVASARLALEDAGLGWDAERPQPRTGVSFGTALGGISNAETEHMRFLKKGPRGVNPTLALQVFGGSAHSNIAIECGFRGVGTTNSNSCASGVVAVGEALRYIRDGWADVIVAGGAEAPLGPLTFGAFDFIRTMSRWTGEPASLACRPFDAERDGFVMGEGACSLIVEEYGHAVRRGARIYAEVLGYSLNNEAYHMTTPHPSGESVLECMRAALADAGVAPSEIGYINPHASSTQLNDANEAMCIRQLFGPGAPPVSGTKPFTAHPLGATGAMETAICALALDAQWLPPTLNHRTPDPACDIDVIPNVGRDHRFRFAMNNAFGFGGIN
ncbi:MAG: beta-ketoacyl-[acyl-carrier-protein] synthase family protein, partial [Chthoniobacteraceae bacterium]